MSFNVEKEDSIVLDLIWPEEKDCIFFWGGKEPNVVICCKLLKESLRWCVYSKKNIIFPLDGEKKGLPGQDARGLQAHIQERGVNLAERLSRPKQDLFEMQRRKVLCFYSMF